MGKIVIPNSTESGATNIVKYLKVGNSGCSIYIGEVKVQPSDEDINAMSAKCLTLVAWEDTTFTFTPSNGQVLSYSVDGGAYTALPSTGGNVSVSGGQEVSWSGTAEPVTATSTTVTSYGIGTFSSTGKFHVQGNVMSLMFGSSYQSATSLSSKNYAFYGLFRESPTLMSAEYLILPATTLSKSCYAAMFYGCTSLAMTPELPASAVSETSYSSMFSGCTSLTVAPELPATELANGCYYYMFANTKIKETPKLPATIIPNNAYREMFKNNSSLTKATELLAETFDGTYGYSYMFSNCSGLKEGPTVLPSKTLVNGCYRYMFNGCSKLEKAPEILATSSVPTSGLTYMFNNCSKIHEIKCLVSGITATNGVTNWVKGVAASGTFIKNPDMNSWALNSTSGVPSGWTVKNDYGDVKYPLTFIARENCTFKFTANASQAESSGNTVQYSVDGGTTWTAQPSTGVSVTAGNAVMWRGSCTSKSGGGLVESGIGNFSSTGKFDAEGNILSLIYNNNFSGQTTTPGTQRQLANLFSGNTNVVNAENLLLPMTTATSCICYGMFRGCTSLETPPELPATTIQSYCYNNMFYGCTSLTRAPKLPATTVSQICYRGMFRGCTSLTEAPELPATVLAGGSSGYCYSEMFAGCTSLTKAPELPAKVVTINAYRDMFSGCTNLKYVKCLATDISASNCTTGWMTGVASQGTFVKDPTMAGWTRGVNGIPTNWNDGDYLTFVALEDGVRFRFNYPVAKESANKLSYSLDDGETWAEIYSTLYTPPLKKGERIKWKGNCEPVDSIGIGTFSSTGNFEVEGNVMSLLYGDNYATQVSLAGKNYAFYNLFYDCTQLVSAEIMLLPATTLSTRCYSQMFYGCTSLTTAPEIPEATMATSCYRSMFNRCSNLVKAPSVIKSATNTMTTSACTYMFYLCSSLTTAPDLPTTTLGSHCYRQMFQGCSSLNYIKAMFTTTPSTSYTRDWVSGVASSGTFVKNANATWDVSGVNGIPTNWTIQTETP